MRIFRLYESLSQPRLTLRQKFLKGDHNSEIEKHVETRIGSAFNVTFVLMEALDQIYLNNMNFIIEVGLNQNFKDMLSHLRQ